MFMNHDFCRPSCSFSKSSCSPGGDSGELLLLLWFVVVVDDCFQSDHVAQVATVVRQKSIGSWLAFSKATKTENQLPVFFLVLALAFLNTVDNNKTSMATALANLFIITSAFNKMDILHTSLALASTCLTTTCYGFITSFSIQPTEQPSLPSSQATITSKC